MKIKTNKGIKEINEFEIIDSDIFVFALKGMPEIKLKIKEKESYSKLVLGAVSDKLPFTLTISLFATSINSSDVKLDFVGDFNPMMSMMIKGPLQKFIDTLAKNMCKL